MHIGCVLVKIQRFEDVLGKIKRYTGSREHIKLALQSEYDKSKIEYT